MRKATLVAAAVTSLVAAGNAAAGTLTLEPRGTQDAQAHWQAQEGIPDGQGNADQALYFDSLFQAPSRAIVHGLEGQRVGTLTGLEWEHRKDGRCDTKAPRWTLFLRVGSKPLTPVRFGCALALHTPGSAPGWIRDTNPQPAIRTRVLRTVGAVGLKATIGGLSIDFDSKGFIYLDNIRVNDTTWRFAGDNGNGPQAPDSLTADDFAAGDAPFLDPELLTTEDLLAFGDDTSAADEP